jgi:hypothetical protein
VKLFNALNWDDLDTTFAGKPLIPDASVQNSGDRDFIKLRNRIGTFLVSILCSESTEARRDL